jgi:hypothetical protein
MAANDVPPGEVTLFLDEDDGLLVSGDLQAVDAVLAELLAPGEVEAHRRATSRVANVAAVGASAAAVATTAQEYLRLTADSLEKVRRLGAQTDGSGALRGYVRGEGGQIAGQLTFETVTFGAEQALAVQTAAVSLALRSAIADVQAAVERVEEKVSDIQRRIGAREIGDVVGIYRKLDRLVAATTARGHLLDADWDSIAGAGLDLERALEAMRVYVSDTVGDIEASASLPKRESAIKRLADPKRVAGTLRLILVAEQALHLWEYLRIERVRRTDPEHVGSALDEARQSMKAQHARDEELVAQTTEAIAMFRTVGPLEVHHFLAIQDMRKASNRALDELDAFATATRAPHPDVTRTIARPKLSETRAEAKLQAIVAKDGVLDVTQTAGRATARRAKQASRRIRRSFPP